MTFYTRVILVWFGWLFIHVSQTKHNWKLSLRLKIQIITIEQMIVFGSMDQLLPRQKRGLYFHLFKSENICWHFKAGDVENRSMLLLELEDRNGGWEQKKSKEVLKWNSKVK